MNRPITFHKMRDGVHVHDETGIEIVRGIDDSDGYDRILWNVWTPNMAETLTGEFPTLPAAKARAREIIAEMQASGVGAPEAASRTYRLRGLRGDAS